MKKDTMIVQSKFSRINYFVKYDSKRKKVFISVDKEVWSLVCNKCEECDAQICAQRYIDSQPEIY